MVAQSMLIYDGNCFFCTKCAEWFAPRSKSEIRPSQSFTEADLLALFLTRNDVDSQVWFIEGTVKYGGADAVSRALLQTKFSLLGRVLNLGIMRMLAARIYKFVSSNRSWFSKIFKNFS